jgi:hypothetical protein
MKNEREKYGQKRDGRARDDALQRNNSASARKRRRESAYEKVSE